jgi:membrane fusion protein
MVISTGGEGDLIASLRIPSRRRGFIKEGQTVRLKLDAFPYIRFGTYPARVIAISRTPVAGARPSAGDAAAAAAAAGGTGERDYIAWVVLSGKTFAADGEQYEILPGMQVTASVVVERRTIAEWILEPVFRMLRG